ncbi:MAG: DNA polymerase III subunit alpha [Candidatus Nealsonbacteria bacterium]|nr:DNA polymerase III subunit alpha [Candidatus Nealsonbacteria bacterium]
MAKFTHLHVHSQYSLLDGLPKIPQLLDRAKELGMDSLALTDHGVLYGAVEFYKEALKRDIKPILGAELYLAAEKMTDRRPNIDDKRYHLVLLVKDEPGYQNLIKLITKAHLEGFYYKPRIDEELLRKHSQGLIGLSACLQGRIPRLIMAKKMKEAEETALRFQEIFGAGNFYLELQHHQSIKEQATLNQALIGLARKTGLPLVATQDMHYLRPEDAEAQDILMLINTGADPNDPERLTMKQDDFSMTTAEQMEEYFQEVPEAIKNTQKISQACNFKLELGKTKLPAFDVPDSKTPDQYLRELVLEKAPKRYPKLSQNVSERIEYELSVIEKTGFASYFLIVQDLVAWAKENRIVVGPGRGSAAGSIISYILGITSVDPIKYNLLFERFLNPERISFPDIDLDFADRRRDEVINYVAEKYGRDRVAQIITFGTMAARAAVRDVGRALGYQYGYCDQLAKMIPFGFTLEETLKKVKEFRDLYEQDVQAKKLVDLAKKLEGVARHASTHACGVVISAEPLENIVPLQHPTQDDQNIVTQYEMHSIEDLGLLKMDFLGLKNLTIIEDTLARIYVIHGQSIDIENIPLDNKDVYKTLREGRTAGIFQLEGQGMTRYLTELKPTEFEDIVAMITLFRPGPMEFIPSFIKRKHGKEKIEYLHPKLKPILENTYGICIYQEQLLQIARDLAGFSYGQADVLRKAVGKKIKSLLNEQREKLIEGMKNNNISDKIAQEIWEWILPFAQYGFNRCLTGDTVILDSKTGVPASIEQLYKKQRLIDQTYSLDDKKKITKNKVVGIFNNGRKLVFEVKTRSGRQIKTTANHPFLTASGWKTLEQISTGERIAVPRKLPAPVKVLDIETHKLAVLGYLLAEGNFCHPASFYFYSTDKEELADYISNLEKFDNTFGRQDGSKAATAVYAKRRDPKAPAQAVTWIESLGLKYKKATEKFFPELVFRLSDKNLSVLLGKMFQGDGCINLKKKDPNIFYATSSIKIARGFQHLLLRFGIISTIHSKKFKYRGGIKNGYTVSISRYNNIGQFLEVFSPHFVGQKKADALKILKEHPLINKTIKTWSARGSKDIIPYEMAFPLVRETIFASSLTNKAAALSYGFSEKLLYPDRRKIGFLRETIDYFADQFKSPVLKEMSNSDIYWDEIVAITPMGREETYDLSMGEDHNFIANDIFVHNSHSCSYAMIAYQTAYLKTLYPVEFMAALLTSEKHDVEKIAFFIEECKRMKIDVLPPDINESLTNFTVVPQERKIRFGLSAIKNVGANVVKAITDERKANGPFRGLSDFLARINSKDLNKKSLESLTRAGVFDSLIERNQILSNLEDILEFNREHQKKKLEGQRNLFEGKINFSSEIHLASAAPATKREKLEWEKELLGLFVTSHPLDGFQRIFKEKTSSLESLGQGIDGQKVKVAGIISHLKKIITKNGRPMLFVNLEDLTSKMEVVVFPSILERNPLPFRENKIVFITGRVSCKDNSPKIICDDVQEILEQ